MVASGSMILAIRWLGADLHAVAALEGRRKNKNTLNCCVVSCRAVCPNSASIWRHLLARARWVHMCRLL